MYSGDEMNYSRRGKNIRNKVITGDVGGRGLASIEDDSSRRSPGLSVEGHVWVETVGKGRNVRTGMCICAGWLELNGGYPGMDCLVELLFKMGLSSK